MGVALGAALIALSAVLFIVQPMFRGLHASLEREDDEMTDTEARKRVALLALRDVEYDFLAGKLDEQDYRSLKGELTAEALAALEADESSKSLSAVGARGPDGIEAEIALARQRMFADMVACDACSFANEAESRFCSACGSALLSTAAG